MNGSQAKRGSGGLRRRCPNCKKLRKYNESDGNHGGEHHYRRPSWGNRDGVNICGWCIYAREGKPAGLPRPDQLSPEERAREKECQKRHGDLRRDDSPQGIVRAIMASDHNIHHEETLVAAACPTKPDGEVIVRRELLELEREGKIERLRSNRWRSRK